MKFIVAVDCEGVACAVGSPGGSLNDSRDLEFAKLQATREADAAARGLFDAGAEQVIVWDNHNGSLNLHYDLLDERCEIALGVDFPHRFPGLDSSFAGVLFIGYHAMDNTENAVIAHTFSSATYQYMKLNGQEIGEMGIDAAVAGQHGVPVIFVAGDDKCIAEARRFFPHVETVTTKQAMGWNAAISKHPKRAVAEIYTGVQNAVARLATMQPYRLEEPLAFQIRFKRLELAQGVARSGAGWQQVDAYTIERRLERLSDYF